MCMRPSGWLAGDWHLATWLPYSVPLSRYTLTGASCERQEAITARRQVTVSTQHSSRGRQPEREKAVAKASASVTPSVIRRAYVAAFACGLLTGYIYLQSLVSRRACTLRPKEYNPGPPIHFSLFPSSALRAVLSR